MTRARRCSARAARRAGRGRVWAHPAARGPRLAAPRLPQHPRVAAAALARRRADPARDPGRRRGDRRHDHADGRGARHGTDARRRPTFRSTPRETAGTLERQLAALGARDRRVARAARARRAALAVDAATRRTARRMRRRSARTTPTIDWTLPAAAHRPPGARVRSDAGRARRFGRANASRSGGRDPRRDAARDAVPGTVLARRARHASCVACGEGALAARGAAARGRQADERGAPLPPDAGSRAGARFGASAQ